MRMKRKVLIISMAKMVVADGGGVHYEDHGVDLTDYLSKDQSDDVFHNHGKDGGA